LRNNIGTAYTGSQAHTISTPAIAELGFTIPPSIHCLGEWPVAEREESIGARISQLRKDKGMTQKELAERLEVSQPVVSDYENDVIRLPADIVGKIARVLEVTSDELLGLKREARSTGIAGASLSCHHSITGQKCQHSDSRTPRHRPKVRLPNSSLPD
jgi:DNA-binding XRE family transcriptional regulator